MSQKTRRRLRRQACQRQNYKCFYCQFKMWAENPETFAREEGIPIRLAKYMQCTAEHLIAQQDSGGDTPGNVVAACLWCNRSRHRGRQHRAPDWPSYKTKVAILVSQGKWHPVSSSASSAFSMEVRGLAPATPSLAPVNMRLF